MKCGHESLVDVGDAGTRADCPHGTTLTMTLTHDALEQNGLM